jgi:hypothetical protein
MIFTFATESRPLSDFSVRHGQLISGLILGGPAVAGVCSAIAIFRKQSPGLIAKSVFGFALCCLTGVGYIYLRSAL